MDPIKENEVILTFSEARAFLRCSKHKLYSLMQSGALKGYKVGQSRVFYKQDLKNLIRESPPPPCVTGTGKDPASGKKGCS